MSAPLTKWEQKKGYNPDKYCKYTGWLLTLVPYRTPEGKLRFWRVRRKDGTNLSTRSFTEQELAWAEANPEAFSEEMESKKAWHKAIQKAKYRD